uniref:Uncharacterized protein n=1 Tax=Candidatus Kentrum sp. FM TaxID=2126340 RepID=A0A450W547_9GAMM|nr:MAG: hypothetical protein BECKFM1743B_GA0114221_102266 [Candidatus Kentron sp. FM]
MLLKIDRIRAHPAGLPTTTTIIPGKQRERVHSQNMTSALTG